MPRILVKQDVKTIKSQGLAQFYGKKKLRIKILRTSHIQSSPYVLFLPPLRYDLFDDLMNRHFNDEILTIADIVYYFIGEK